MNSGILRAIFKLLMVVLFSQFIFAQEVPDLTGIAEDQFPAVNPGMPMYQHTGEQYRAYDFPGTGESVPYRLFVPESWTPGQSMPILVTLRAGPSINNNHRNDNDLVVQARERGYIVISPLGYRGYFQPYYGSPYPIDRPAGPSEPGAGWTEEEDQRAEQDVLNTIQLVVQEYGADTSRIYIHGQNPSGSAAFNYAAKYPDLVKGIIVSAGPIVTENYPFENLQGKVSVLMIHGTADTANTPEASQRVVIELGEHGIEAEFHDVPDGEHLTAYLTFASEIFDFLDSH